MDATTPSGDGVLLGVRVQPKASRDAIVAEPDGRIRVALTAPPVGGAANKALVALISRRLGVAKRDVVLIRGEHSRDKTLRLSGVTLAEVRTRLGVQDEGTAT